MIFLVHSHVDLPSPYSVKRWLRVSLLSHSLQLSVGDNLIRCSPSFVGIMPCAALYQVAVSASDIGASIKFPQVVFQSD